MLTIVAYVATGVAATAGKPAVATTAADSAIAVVNVCTDNYRTSHIVAEAVRVIDYAIGKSLRIKLRYTQDKSACNLHVDAAVAAAFGMRQNSTNLEQQLQLSTVPDLWLRVVSVARKIALDLLDLVWRDSLVRDFERQRRNVTAAGAAVITYMDEKRDYANLFLSERVSKMRREVTRTSPTDWIKVLLAFNRYTKQDVGNPYSLFLTPTRVTLSNEVYKVNATHYRIPVVLPSNDECGKPCRNLSLLISRESRECSWTAKIEPQKESLFSSKGAVPLLLLLRSNNGSPPEYFSDAAADVTKIPVTQLCSNGGGEGGE